MAQCAFIVPQVKNCQCLMSKNLYHRLRRINVSQQGLHFNLPSLYSSHTWSPLRRALIRIFMRGLSRFVKLLYILSPIKLPRYRRSGSRYRRWSSSLCVHCCLFCTKKLVFMPIGSTMTVVHRDHLVLASNNWWPDVQPLVFQGQIVSADLP